MIPPCWRRERGQGCTIGASILAPRSGAAPTAWCLRHCIGCGCLSLGYCKILNPDDRAGLRRPGPRHILDDD
jgi:hypothetical protein